MSGGKKQTTIDKSLKKVSFARSDKEKEEFEERMRGIVQEEVKKVKRERVLVEKLKVDIDAKNSEILERLETLEAKFEEFKDDVKARLDAISAAMEGAASETSDGVRGSTSSLCSRRSRWSVASGESRVSLSEREVWRMKKIVSEQDRKDRQENIVIKGVRVEEEDLAKWAQAFIKEKLTVDAEVLHARKSGNVIIVKIGSAEQKNEIMINKNKLVGTRIFIENDLPYEDRKRQEEIQRWVKEKRELGFDVRAGRGKIALMGHWWVWGEKEKLEKKLDEIRETKEQSNKKNSEKKDF